MTAKKSKSKTGSAKPAQATTRRAATPAAPAKGRAAKQAAPAKPRSIKAAPRQTPAPARKPKAAKPALPRKAPAKPAPASPARKTKTVQKPSRVSAPRPKPKQASKTPSHVTTPLKPKTRNTPARKHAAAPAKPEKKPLAKPVQKPVKKPVQKPTAKSAHAASAKGKASARSPFSPVELDSFYRAMLEMRKRLLVQVSELRQQSLLRHDEVNQDEDGTDAFERVTSLDRASVEQGEVVKINNALMAIKEGTYGLCDGCGCKIEKIRLKALPFAKTCIRCQSEMENQNSRRKSTHDLWD